MVATNCCTSSNIMSSVTPERSDNDGPQPQLVISAHDSSIRALTYLPNGRVVTGSRDKTVRVWNLENGEQEGTSMLHENGVYSLAVTQDGTKITSCDEVGVIKVWDVESHQLVKEWIQPDWVPIAISPDDRFIAQAYQTIFIHAIEGEWPVNQLIGVGKKVWSMSFSPDSDKLACSTCDDNIRVYDVSNGALVLGPIKGHQRLIWNLLWSHDGSRLFSGSWDGTIRCWNSDTGEQIGHPWTGHTDDINSISLSPDGSILASASHDQTVRFWDAASGCPIGQPLRHEERIHAVCFSPSGEFVASAGLDGKIYLWQVPCIGTIENQVMMPIRCITALVLITLHSLIDTSSSPRREQPTRPSSFPHPTITISHTHSRK